MDSVDRRLSRCFAAVFPDIAEVDVVDASIDTREDWDSLQSITLTTVVEEEFGLQIDPLDLPDLGSYRAISEYLRAALSEAQ